MLCIDVIVVVVIFITLIELCSTPPALQSAATVDGAAGVLGSGEDPLNFLPQDELLGMLIGDGLGKNGESESNSYLFSLGNTACMKLCGVWVTSYNVDIGLPMSDSSSRVLFLKIWRGEKCIISPVFQQFEHMKKAMTTEM